MPAGTPIKPLARNHRQHTFFLLLFVFVVAIPVLYLYATGYRFDLKGGTNFISTGGIFISAERTGAEIYIDNELVRETRVFRRAFYAQNLDPGTHRVHVQREGSHTWVKELPVYPHLVTEAQAFNLPLAPQARVIARYTTVEGAPVAFASSSVHASSTQLMFIATTTATSTFRINDEFTARLGLFIAPTSTATSTSSVRTELGDLFSRATTTATSTTEQATTTKEQNGVRLFESGDDVFASWVGPREGMPYYYCAEPFPLVGTSTEPLLMPGTETGAGKEGAALALYAADGVPEESSEIEGKVQEIAPNQECKPNIRIDRKWQDVQAFDFFPGTTDLVVMALEHGIYAVEIDDRAWQNVQPIMEGENLMMQVENGRIYIYDGTFIYEMILE